MTGSVRRAAVVLLTGLLLASIPGLAHAQFAAQSRASLIASTATVGTVSGLSATVDCKGNKNYLWVTVNITNAASRGLVTGYEFTLRHAGQPVAQAVTSTPPVQLSSDRQGNDGGAYTVTVVPRIGSWTGPTYTAPIACQTVGAA